MFKRFNQSKYEPSIVYMLHVECRKLSVTPKMYTVSKQHVSLNFIAVKYA
jgi:hypothetical protein